ncbi:MAG: adenylate/guanylate cyclase domain-containing protein [Hyphomonadaceae bacterium]|nr:adenylate/guanylate cyclase domain-containing protein [Hyphomonadaceae bacterium]
MSEVRRKLTTILAADADGYSRAMEADEVRALGELKAARDVFTKFIQRHHGRIANTAGDGLIAEFPSVVEAVQCAIEVQRELGAGAAAGALRFRIGVHLGDVMIDGDDLLGEGVNLAARLQTMAAPGGILISRQVYDQVAKKLSVGFEYLGERKPKNFEESVAVYGVASTEAGEAPRAKRDARPARAAAAPPPDLRAKLIRRAQFLGVIALAFIGIDLATGDSFWAQWPILGMAGYLAFRAAPLFSGGWFHLAYARIAVIIGILAGINLLSWSGTVWVIYPAAGLIILAVIGRLLAKS